MAARAGARRRDRRGIWRGVLPAHSRSGRLLPPAGILLGDGGSGELRLYDENGRHQKSAGGIGSGPGEFQRGIGGAMQWLGRIRGDSILAWDLPLHRLTVFDPQLEYVRNIPLRLPVMAFVVAGAFADDDLFIWPFGVRTSPVPSARVVMDTSYVAVHRRADPARLDTIIRLPARPTWIEPDGESLRVPFTAEPAFAVGSHVRVGGKWTAG